MGREGRREGGGWREEEEGGSDVMLSSQHIISVITHCDWDDLDVSS